MAKQTKAQQDAAAKRAEQEAARQEGQAQFLERARLLQLCKAVANPCYAGGLEVRQPAAVKLRKYLADGGQLPAAYAKDPRVPAELDKLLAD